MTTMTTGERPLPGPLRIGLSRAWLEVREFTRHWESVAFTFALPALILLLFGTIFDGATGTEIPAADFYLPGLIAMGLMSVSFQNLAIAITLERDNGTLRRLRGTPMPPSAYFVGKTALVFVLALGQVAVLLAIAVGVYGADLPAGPKAWATMAWVFVLGTIACSLLGIAFSSLARSAKSASAIVIVPFLALQFTSGVFVPLMVLPDWLVNVASLFPLKWMAQGMRAAFYPAEAAALEPGGSWDLTTAGAVLGVWCVVGLALTLATFRWKTGKDG